MNTRRRKAAPSGKTTDRWYNSTIAKWAGGVVTALLLAVITPVAVDYFQHDKQQKAEAISLHNEFNELGLIPRRAKSFVDQGRYGSKDDLLSVYRHFVRVFSFVTNKQTTTAHILKVYRRRDLEEWANRFDQLAQMGTPVDGWFSESDRKDFGLLAGIMRTGLGLTLAATESETSAMEDSMLEMSNAMDNVANAMESYPESGNAM